MGLLTAGEREAVRALLSRPACAPRGPHGARGGAISKACPSTATLRSELDRLASRPKMPAASAQAGLPMRAHREALLDALAQSGVVLVRGAPGCGKSTQVPQIMLEHAAASGAAPCGVLVAAPRRLAATALAARVSAELGEESVGGLCGYAIRGESRLSDRTCVTFVTTGVLLRRLESQAGLDGIGALILDEVGRPAARGPSPTFA